MTGEDDEGPCPHPQSGLELDLAVGPRALQQEALFHAHVGGLEEAVERQVEDTKEILLLVLFDLEMEHAERSNSFLLAELPCQEPFVTSQRAFPGAPARSPKPFSLRVHNVIRLQYIQLY